jgi:hypothetical protein
MEPMSQMTHSEKYPLYVVTVLERANSDHTTSTEYLILEKLAKHLTLI